MSFVFLSYAREDAAVAAAIVRRLKSKRLDVFWDQDILFGIEFKNVIADRLESAACILVLWSQHSAKSHWVNYEAHVGLERTTLIEVRLDDARLPPPFGNLNVADLRAWHGSSRDATLIRLLQSVEEKLDRRGDTHSEFSLAAPMPGQRMTDSHVALIHTSWRTPKYDEAFEGVETYRWDIALYGSTEALDRVAEVTYFLHPAYEMPDAVPPSFAINRLKAESHRATCFRLRQIANGHSLVRAHVSILGQDEAIELSRYVNLFDSAANIADYLM